MCQFVLQLNSKRCLHHRWLHLVDDVVGGGKGIHRRRPGNRACLSINYLQDSFPPDYIMHTGVQQADSVVSKIERLKNQFDQLHDQLMAELKIHSISMNMLLDALTLLPLSLRREYDVRGLCTLTSKGITTDELFIVHLNPLMNFIDYGLLAHLIRNFGSGSLKEDMHTYESNVQLFMKQTTISEIVGPGVDHLPNQQDTPPKFTKLMTKITLEGAQHITLEQLDALRLKFCAHLKLSEVVFRLKRVEIG